ncbi:uncharacterized protein LOC110442820 [Mizuhopecten yessoensis]|uniref:Uncharacterized protein n=1 Tax=Mizuhopecten yessoensis TaxID=6573 RepID=A0A210PGD2_MIZYE|nr:uncharacterized protein LOC110442820 [Mizuhopecten yessoensis]OWF35550.1 hypothetical protein KP79_PYT08403 [Mizuhopecten yessoensis]
MDPVFGLPVVKESRAMESARNRNRTQQRRLGSQLTKLHYKLECSTSRILQHKNIARDLWNTIQPPTPNKNVVCPSGLTNQEKSVYKHMRKSGPLSMSLEEFDKKMEELKYISAQSRQTDKVENPPKRRRRNSEVVTGSTRRGSIVPDEDQIRSPLLNRKHKMKEALGRLETSDVRVKDQNITDQYKSTSRRHSSILPSLPGGSRNGASDTNRNHSSTSFQRRRSSVAVVSLETPRNERLVSSSSDEGKQTMEDVKTLMGQLAINLT